MHHTVELMTHTTSRYMARIMYEYFDLVMPGAAFPALVCPHSKESPAGAGKTVREKKGLDVTAPGRVLVIEDNPESLELMSYLLRASGYPVLAVKGGAEGIETALREKPDAIICDIRMPGVDGYDVARSLKGHPVLRQTPIIAVTALSMSISREKLLAQGFDDYIEKPITPEKFVEQVENAMRKKGE